MILINNMATKDIALTKKLNDHNCSNWLFKLENWLQREDVYLVILNPHLDPMTADWTKK